MMQWSMSCSSCLWMFVRLIHVRVHDSITFDNRTDTQEAGHLSRHYRSTRSRLGRLGSKTLAAHF